MLSLYGFQCHAVVYGGYTLRNNDYRVETALTVTYANLSVLSFVCDILAFLLFVSSLLNNICRRRPKPIIFYTKMTPDNQSYMNRWSVKSSAKKAVVTVSLRTHSLYLWFLHICYVRKIGDNSVYQQPIC